MRLAISERGNWRVGPESILFTDALFTALVPKCCLLAPVAASTSGVGPDLPLLRQVLRRCRRLHRLLRLRLYETERFPIIPFLP
jgi:hypothetical protein